MRGQAIFRPTRRPPTAADWKIVPTRSGSGATAGRIFQGAPNDRQLTNALTAPQTYNCNEISEAAITAVGRIGHLNRHESRAWQNFDVRKP